MNWLILFLYATGLIPKTPTNCASTLSSQRLESVRDLAIRAHGKQRYGNQPYKVHLDAVNAVLREFGINDLNNPFHVDILEAGYIHDVLEDTNVTKFRLERDVGETETDFAWRVTDGEGKTRKERKAVAYAKIAGSLGATIVKLADRIANTRASVNVPKKMLMYMGEYPEFRQKLYDPAMTLAQPFWDELDRLYLIHGS